MCILLTRDFDVHILLFLAKLCYIVFLLGGVFGCFLTAEQYLYKLLFRIMLRQSGLFCRNLCFKSLISLADKWTGRRSRWMTRTSIKYLVIKFALLIQEISFILFSIISVLFWVLFPTRMVDHLYWDEDRGVQYV